VFIALTIQHAMRMRLIVAHAPYCTIICELSGLQYFSSLCHKRHDFRRKTNFLDTKCVFWFSVSLFSTTYLILKRIPLNIRSLVFM